MDKYLISLYRSGKGKYISNISGFFLRNNGDEIDFAIATTVQEGKREQSGLESLNTLRGERQTQIKHNLPLKLELITFYLPFWFVIFPLVCRLIDIDTGIVSDVVSTRSTSSDHNRVALQWSVGHLGALHLFIRTLRRLVSVRLEILQGKRRQQLNQQQSNQLKLSMRNQNVPKV